MRANRAEDNQAGTPGTRHFYCPPPAPRRGTSAEPQAKLAGNLPALDFASADASAGLVSYADGAVPRIPVLPWAMAIASGGLVSQGTASRFDGNGVPYGTAQRGGRSPSKSNVAPGRIRLPL